MVIIVKERVELWKQIWSWPVVSVVVPLVLGGGIAFMTSNHPWLADVFYLTGGILFIVKFSVWEVARGLDTAKRRNPFGLAIGLTLAVLCGAIWGNHRLNAPQDAPRVVQSPSTEQPPEKKPEATPNAGTNGATQSPEKQTPAKRPNTKQERNTSVKRQANSPGAPNIQVNNAPNGIAIGGGTVVNPTVNNNYAVQTKPGRTVTDADRIQIVAYLSQVKATVSLKAPLGDKEATNYAVLWYGILKDAQWVMKDRIVLAYMTVGGNPEPGAILYEKGEPVQAGKEVPVPNTDPLAYIASALKSQGVPISLQRDLNQEEGLITVQFGPRPE
jgi:hypothetical protein